MIVEIKARFDEHANIRWARKLEQAGCHVVYGLVGLKTHCKLAMVVRDEPDGIRRYAHIGTGNYNPKTARLYEDIGPAHRRRGDRRGRRPPVQQPVGLRRNATYYRSCWWRPTTVRTGLVDRIEHEIEHHRAGRPARIRLKANSIVDEAIIDALYLRLAGRRARRALVRGICALRPGVPGLSETITVRSVLGPLPGAQPRLLVRERRRPGGVDRVGRPDAPQPRPPGRGAGPAARGRGHRERDRGRCSTWPSTRTTVAWELEPDGEWAPQRGRRTPPRGADRAAAQRGGRGPRLCSAEREALA